MKAGTWAVVAMGLMTVSTVAALAGVGYQVAIGDRAERTPESSASQAVLPAPTGDQPGDNLAVSAFKFVCPFH